MLMTGPYGSRTAATGGGTGLRGTAACLLAILLTGATTARDKEAAPRPRVEDMSRGAVQVTITIDPATIRMDRDVIMTVKISAPTEVEVAMPSLDDRTTGFIINGTLDREPVTHAGRTTLERQLLLTPVISDEYRLAPFPVTCTDRSRSPAESSWFATRPLVIDVAPVTDGKAGKEIDVTMKPIWIYPPFKTVVLYFFAGLLSVAAAFFAWKLMKKLRRQIQLLRMSPRERALVELAELIARDLVAKNLVKEFYLELTMIVRRYIERAHSIRAPEQTTEEFLRAVSSDARFSREVINRLKAFLEAADLVKFAAYRPDQDSIRGATDTARHYVESDSADQLAAAARGGAK